MRCQPIAIIIVATLLSTHVSASGFDIQALLNIANIVNSGGNSVDIQTLITLANTFIESGGQISEATLTNLARVARQSNLNTDTILALIRAVGYNVNIADLQAFMTSGSVLNTNQQQQIASQNVVQSGSSSSGGVLPVVGSNIPSQVSQASNTVMTALLNNGNSVLTYDGSANPAVALQGKSPINSGSNMKLPILSQSVSSSSSWSSGSSSPGQTGAISSPTGSGIYGRYLVSDCKCSCYATVLNGRAVSNNQNPFVASYYCPSTGISNNMGSNCYCQCCGTPIAQSQSSVVAEQSISRVRLPTISLSG